MKRFTETEKWRDPWFRKLSPSAKLLWLYLCDICSRAGIAELDMECASFEIGLPITNETLGELKSRLSAKDSKLLIRKFIEFQCGKEPTPSCPAHKPVIAEIERYGLVRTANGYEYPNGSLAIGTHNPNAKVALRYHEDSELVLDTLNKLSGKKFRATDTNLGFISSRLSEEGVTTEGVMKMIERQCRRWAGTEQSEYLRPETLFNKTKFDGYYAAKDLPITDKQKPLPEANQIQEKITVRSI